MKTIAIIGATGFALERMIPEMAHSTSCKVLSIQGRDYGKLQAVRKKHGIPNAFLNTEEMLLFSQYDGVYICTPPFCHSEQIKSVCAANRAAILCEKPLVLSLEEATEIQRICKASGTVLMIGHHIRHQRAIKDLRDLIAENAIGDILSVQAQWSYVFDVGKPYAKWKWNPILGGESAMQDAGIHVVDLLTGLFGIPIYAVAAGHSMRCQDTIDTVSTVLKYHKMLATITTSQAMGAANNDLIINGTRGRIDVVNAFSQEYIRSIRVYSGAGAYKKYRYKQTLLYRNEMECLVKRKMYGIAGTTVEEALQEIRTVQAINLAIRSGVSVAV